LPCKFSSRLRGNAFSISKCGPAEVLETGRKRSQTKNPRPQGRGWQGQSRYFNQSREKHGAAQGQRPLFRVGDARVGTMLRPRTPLPLLLQPQGFHPEAVSMKGAIGVPIMRGKSVESTNACVPYGYRLVTNAAAGQWIRLTGEFLTTLVRSGAKMTNPRSPLPLGGSGLHC
jgi:hypothetical protein